MACTARGSCTVAMTRSRPPQRGQARTGLELVGGGRSHHAGSLLAGHAEYVSHALALRTTDEQLGSGSSRDLLGVHAGQTGLYRYAIQTDLMLTNSRMPYSESSRP
jgi:hypothetical protein